MSVSGLDELKATHLSLLAAISTLRDKVEKVRDNQMLARDSQRISY